MLLEKKEMESLEFINKIWVPDKPRIWERFLQVLIIIYCFLQIFIFIMDSNIDAKSCVFLILAIYAGFWISKQMKRKGKYVEAKCILRFSDGKLVLEYPKIEIESKPGQLGIKYTILKDSITEVSLSKEMHSIRLLGRPIMIMTENKKRRIIDFQKKKRICTLILYYDKIEEIEKLMRKYLNIDINFVD